MQLIYDGSPKMFSSGQESSQDGIVKRRLMQGAGGIGEKAAFVATCGDMTEQKT